MAPSRTRTVKNKHAANKSGVSGSKSSSGGGKPQSDGVVKHKKPQQGKAPPAIQMQGQSRVSQLLKKKKKRVYTAEELGIPELNMITPVGVQKPKGKKKGKVFVDDKESMSTILALVQAEKDGQVESKMIKARQMEEIREARKVEAAKKEAERNEKLEDTKESLRKKRKRPRAAGNDESVNDVSLTGSKAKKTKKKVAFAE